MNNTDIAGPCRKKILLITLSLTVVWMAGSTFSAGKAESGINDAPTKPASVKRDPFWPLGYVPERIKNQELEKAETPEASTSNSNWNEAMMQVVINGVSSRGDNESFAVINGQVKTAGDSVAIVYQQSTYTWAVESITPPNSVKLRRISIK